MSPRILWGGIVMLVLAGPLAAGDFGPDIETSFDSLVAGEAAVLTQEYVFFEGESGPAALLLEFDKGSFDFTDIEVDDVIGTLLLEVDIDNPFPFPDIVGDILGELTVTSVEDDVVEADLIITEVDDDVLTALELLGFDDPTDEVAFIVTLTDFEDDDGALIEMEEGDALPVSEDELAFDIPMTFEFDPFYVHSPDGGELLVTTTITPGEGDDFTTDETFKIEGGDEDPIFKRGDADGDGTVSGIPDGLFVLKFQFEAGAKAPPCMAAADCNGSGDVSGIPDGLFILRWQFEAGAEVPPDPGPTKCGADPNELDCETEPDCT